MKAHKIIMAAVVLCALVAAPLGTAAAAPPTVPVCVLLAPGATLDFGLGPQGRTGIADFDARLASAGAVSVEPALKSPPRGDGEPAQRLRRYLRVDCATSLERAALVQLLAGSPVVELVEVLDWIPLAFIPDDSLYFSQWAHANTGQATVYGSDDHVGTPDCDTDTDLAWDYSVGATTITIAIVDTGVDYTHPEFDGRIVPGHDFVNDDADAMDDIGHGTCCAGIAAANTNDDAGIAGVAWLPRIMPVKTFNAQGGMPNWCADGIVWAVDHGADILSCSWGSPTDWSLIRDAVAYAYGEGVPLFCAAGNANQPALNYPAALTQYTIPVGAMSPCNERKSPQSCDGETWWGSNYTNLAFLCPGVRMHAPDIVGPGGYAPGDYWHEMGGTSGATPHAAGIGAPVLALNPALTPAQLEGRLAASAQDMGPVGYDSEHGYGRLNAHLAVLSAFVVPTYVNAANDGVENGSLHRPYQTFAAGLAHVPESGTLVVFGGAYPDETLIIDAPVTLIGKDGIARIGN